MMMMIAGTKAIGRKCIKSEFIEEYFRGKKNKSWFMGMGR